LNYLIIVLLKRKNESCSQLVLVFGWKLQRQGAIYYQNSFWFRIAFQANAY